MTSLDPKRFPARLAWFVLPLLPLFAAPSAAEPADAPAVDYMIVVTGGELLCGVYPDAHTQYLTRTLHPLGLHCVGSLTCDDRRADILEALRFAVTKARLVIVTGGLGPTDNDITRETLSEFTRVPIEENGQVLEAMEKRFGKPRADLPGNLRRQSLVPQGGEFFPNANGTAVGLLFHTGTHTIVALPGPPRELERMVSEELVPCLVRRFGIHSAGCSLLARFVGIGQSGVDQAIEEHISLPRDVVLQSQFDGRRVDFTFILPRDTPEDRARLDALKKDLLTHLGEFIYAFDETSLEQLVLARLENEGKTLAVAEVGSGGALAANLNREPRAARVLRGAFSAPSDQILARMLHVPEAEWAKSKPGTERAARLAAAVSRETGSDWTVFVGEPDQAGSGDPAITVVILSPSGPAESLRVSVRGPADQARAGLVTHLLGELRRRLP